MAVTADWTEDFQCVKDATISSFMRLSLRTLLFLPLFELSGDTLFGKNKLSISNLDQRFVLTSEQVYSVNF